MRCTDFSLVLVHLSNSESWLTSLLASVWSLTLQMWLWREKKSSSFPEHGTQSSPPTPAHTVSPLHLHTWEVFFSALLGCHSWAQCLTSQTRNPNPDRVPLRFPKSGGFTQTFPHRPEPATAARNRYRLQPRFVLQGLYFSSEHAGMLPLPGLDK